MIIRNSVSILKTCDELRPLRWPENQKNHDAPTGLILNKVLKFMQYHQFVHIEKTKPY